MRFAVVSLALSVLLAGCAPSRDVAVGRREPLPSRAASSEIKDSIDAIIADTLFPPAHVGIEILDLESGKVLYDLESSYLNLPASNQKLLTSATALATLGPAFTFATGVWIDTAVTPRLYVKGGGDPLLSTADIDSIAAAIVPQLPPGKAWTLCADVSFFDDIPWGSGWMWDDEPSSDEMYISPLSANANCVVVRVQPGITAGDTPVVSVEPPTASITVENNATTVTDTVRTPLTISRKWRERSNTVTVSGEMLAGDRGRKEKLSVYQPEWYTLSLFREALTARGIACEGMLADTVPSRATGLFRFERRLDSVVTFMNKQSDNLSAENVLRTISATTWGAPGTADGGLAVVKTFLTSCGIDTTQLVVADGSGVSRYNLVSPKALVTLLASMYKRPDIFPAWYYSLPIAGEDGTLTARMRGTAAASNLRAKTGTLSGVTTLSGFVRTAGGNMLAFSIMVEGFPGDNYSYRRVQDRIGAYLARQRRSPM